MRQYYVNHRWLGGMLTNWKAISGSIKTLADLEATLADEAAGLTKKEMLRLVRRRNKLELALGGIRDMGACRRARGHRYEQGRHRDSGGASWASRSLRSSTAIAIPTSSPIPFPATTMRSVRSTSIATCSLARSSTVFRWSSPPRAPISGAAEQGLARICRRSMATRPMATEAARRRRPMATRPRLPRKRRRWRRGRGGRGSAGRWRRGPRCPRRYHRRCRRGATGARGG